MSNVIPFNRKQPVDVYVSDHEKARKIIERVEKDYGLPEGRILSQKRHRVAVEARTMAMKAVKKSTTLSLPEIAEVFDRLCHTTVIAALKRPGDASRYVWK